MNAALETTPVYDEAAIERESVEQVFGLTGGELEARPWEPWAPSALYEPEAFDFNYATEGSKRRTFPYWYEGTPVGVANFRDIYDPFEGEAPLCCACMDAGPDGADGE